MYGPFAPRDEEFAHEDLSWLTPEERTTTSPNGWLRRETEGSPGLSANSLFAAVRVGSAGRAQGRPELTGCCKQTVMQARQVMFVVEEAS